MGLGRGDGPRAGGDRRPAGALGQREKTKTKNGKTTTTHHSHQIARAERNRLWHHRCGLCSTPMKLLCPPLLSLFPLLSPSVAAFRTQLYSGRHLTNLNMSRHDDLIEKERAKAGFRYVEGCRRFNIMIPACQFLLTLFCHFQEIGPGLRLDMELKRLLHTSLSEFQEVQVVETYFGMTLVTGTKRVCEV